MDKILSNKVYILSAIRRSEMSKNYSKVKVWSEKVSIPTYGVGKPDKNPMFLEKRVYQGSSGRVYPHPVTDKIFDKKQIRNIQQYGSKMILSKSWCFPK